MGNRDTTHTAGLSSHAQTLKSWFVMVRDSRNTHPGNKLPISLHGLEGRAPFRAVPQVARIAAQGQGALHGIVAQYPWISGFQASLIRD